MAYLRAFFSLFPAHAGVILREAKWTHSFLPFPRTRGGDPETLSKMFKIAGFSPHTRG